MTDREMRHLLFSLMSAGHDTLLHQLGSAMALFIDHPEQWRLLAERPELSIQAAEEVVRFCPAALLGLPRIATVDVEIHGRRFASGDCLLPITGSANRDARVFESPDRFDITCKRSTHLTFGGGIHHCLGAALARAELQVALSMLASRLSDLRDAGPAEWRPPTEAVFGPTRLPIRCRVRPA